VPASRALAVGASLARRMAQPDAPAAVLYGAALDGDAIALGRMQRGMDALSEDARARGAHTLVRRHTGGPAANASSGVVYCALVLRHASALMECPPDRVLNRNVRGFLSGLGKGSTPAHYFGREWLSLERRPAALLAWTRSNDGAVLLEALIARETPFALSPGLDGYPERAEPPFLGKEPITLAEAWHDAPDPEALIQGIAEGHATRFEGLEIERSSLSDEEREAARALEPELVVDLDAEAADGLSWSRPREIPIGFVSAAVAIGDGGTVADVRVAGDFYSDEDAVSALRDALVGEPPDAARFQAAINDTWDGTRRVIEGVKSLQPILDALIEAAKL
jgi:hypothetical protein